MLNVDVLCSAVQRDQSIDGGNHRLCFATLVPPQISALVEPLDRVIIEHAGDKALTTVHGSARSPRPNSPRPMLNAIDVLLHP